MFSRGSDRVPNVVDVSLILKSLHTFANQQNLAV